MLCAEVEGKINNKSFTTVIREPLWVFAQIQFDTERRPDNDTVDALNEYLADLAKNVGTSFEDRIEKVIYLGNTTYEGTIVIPEEFDGLNSVVIIGQNASIIKGSIKTNGYVQQVVSVHFIASESEAVDGITKGIYGGGKFNGTKLIGCSFRGYDIAIDASEGLKEPLTSNVFADNGVAILLDIAGTRSYGTPSQWTENTFVNNGTAVKVLSLNDQLTPHYFRIYDSNFIGNETDFDIRCEGKFYMYRNFFGKIHPQAEDMDTGEYLIALSKVQDKNGFNQLANSNPPRIELDKKITEVITNPRQKRPVTGWWESSADIEDIFGSAAAATLLSEGDEDVLENELVVDWELKTDIINEEADQLVIDPSAFEEEGEKKITVVEGESGELGFWTFD